VGGRSKSRVSRLAAFRDHQCDHSCGGGDVCVVFSQYAGPGATGDSADFPLFEYFGISRTLIRDASPKAGIWLDVQGHAKQHRCFFTHTTMPVNSIGNFKVVLFPPFVIVFFLLGFGRHWRC